MNNSKLPLFYFPTQLMIIDDNTDFLNNLSLNMDKDIAAMHYSDPQLAIHKLNENNKEHPAHKHVFIKYINTDEYDTKAKLFNIDFLEVHKQIYNPHRFSQISTVLIDYKMPLMSGADFCKQIQHLPVKKIMLTGEAGYDTAVDNFNKGRIDKFIVKNSKAMLHQIHTAIREAQHAYFYELSKTLLDTLSNETSALNETAYIQWVHDIIHQKNIVEYYVVDQLGSFLLVDENNCINWLAVISEETTNEYYETAIDRNLSEDMLSLLKEKQEMPFEFMKDIDKLDPSEWSTLMHPVSKLTGTDTNYYVSQIDVTKHVEQQKIVFYHQYLKTHALRNEDLYGDAI